MKKSRFFSLHPVANAGKVAALDALQEEYTEHLKTCVQAMLAARRFTVPLKEQRGFFPACERLSSQIAKNVRAHAVAIVSGWASSNYAVKLKKRIASQLREKLVDEPLGVALYIIGKHSVNGPSERVTQEALDLYWSWLLDEAVVGKAPTISSRCGMRMSEMTAVLASPKEASMASWWLAFSHLESGEPRIQLPLAGNPYVKNVNDVSNGILARKDRRGRWRFEVVEKREWEGIKFRCRGCGRLSHADVVGAKGALGRSEDKLILLDDHYTHVGAILRERYRARRRDSSSGAHTAALVPSSRGLTEGCP